MTHDKPVKILHVLAGMVRGGAETLLMHLLRNIDRDRYRIDILTHTEKPCPYDDEVRSLGSRIIPCMGYPNPLLYARNFRRGVREHGPYDVIHGHAFYFNSFLMFLAASEGIPIRISHIYPHKDIKDPEGTSRTRGIYRQVATRFILRYATRIVSDSHASLSNFRKIGNHDPDKESVIYPGIDLAPFARTIDRSEVRRRHSLPLDRPLITYVARFVPHKNHDQLIRVADILAREGCHCHFALAGTHGSKLEEIKRAVEGRSDISMLIGLGDVSELLMASDLFFFPSLEEGFGMVAAEAAAAGLPIVATNLPTIREAIPPGQHRFMFPPDDDRSAVANIRTILGDAGLSAELGREAHQWIPRYSFRNALEQTVALYNGSR